MEPTGRPEHGRPRHRLQETEHIPRSIRRLAGFISMRILRGKATGSNGATNGRHAQENGVANGRNGNGHGPEQGDKSSGEGLQELSRSAARKAIERVEAQDPLSERYRSYYPGLLIGPQMSYDPATWSPDPRARAPIGSPERVAWETDPNRITAADPKVLEMFDFLDELDASSGFNDAHD